MKLNMTITSVLLVATACAAALVGCDTKTNEQPSDAADKQPQAPGAMPSSATRPTK